ncbi:MAG: phosphate uptake regulator PhoU [Nitrososphaerota archaeon]|nr:phosphate uptake regulator PhoU [Nitrososphaerota archaeon]
MGKTVPSQPGRRSLQAIKGGSYTITLPRWWVTKHSMEKGAELFVVEDGVSLKLAPTKLMGEKKKAEIHMESVDDVKSIRYLLWTYYMQGADVMTVSSRKVMPVGTKKELREVRLDLPGIEVAKEDGYSVTFEVTLGQEKKPLDTMIGEIQEIALSIHRDAFAAVMKGDVDLAAEVIGREPEILRSYRAMIRKLAVCSVNSQEAYDSGIKDSRELITYGLLVRDLNRTVYHGIYIARHMKDLAQPIEEGILRSLRRMSEAAYEMQRLSVEAFLNKDYSRVLKTLKLMELVKTIDGSIGAQISKGTKNVKKAVAGMLIAREIRRIAGYSIGMADAASNRIFFPSGESS